MMNGVVILLVAIFIRHSLYRLRFFAHMFQLVGYKTNEYRSWLSEHFYSRAITPEHIFFNIIILFMIYVFADRVTLTAGAIIMFIFTLFWFVGLSRYSGEKEKKPLVYTARMKRLWIAVLLLLALSWFYLIDFAYRGLQLRDFAAPFINTDPYFLSFGMVLVDMFVPVFLMLAAWLIKPVETFIQNGFKKKARKKLATLPGLKVIAITGSYGKTSTKFVIDAFLKERLSVCVTPGSFNTPMGICKVINNDLDATHQVLILEMGARYRGNILELCRIARPDISVITNVGLAHLETFGSQDVIAYEKGTLARELKPGGTLVLNGDDDLVKKMASLRNDVEVVMTGTNGRVKAKDIEITSEGTAFTMLWLNMEGSVEDEERIRTRLLGAHNIQNLLLGAAVARQFGIRLKTIALAASAMKPVEHRLELKQRNGLTIIDDAFNSNPVGAKNAVDILASFTSGRKILITPGMIELGDLEDEQNRKFGKHIGKANLDLIILVGEGQTKAIAEGIKAESDGNVENLKIARTLFEANDILKEYVNPGDVVLYENDLPDTYNK